jgi:hypothetical protein
LKKIGQHQPNNPLTGTAAQGGAFLVCAEANMAIQKVLASMRSQCVLAAMRGGATLHRTNLRISTIWQLSNGMPVTEETARAVIAHGHVVGVGDSLFGHELSQTWRYRENENG